MTAVLSCNLCGCMAQSSAVQTESVSGNEIELLEPVGGSASYDTAQYRDIYQVKVYPSICSPSVTEFAYTTEAPFNKYGKLPGEAVGAGDVLVYGETKSLDEERNALSESIEDKIRDYEDAVTDLQEDIYDARKIEYEASIPYMENINNRPQADSPYFDMWAKFSMPVEGAYKSAVMTREKIQQSLKEKQELFALELEYEKGRLARMEDKIDDAQITSNKEGTVVAINAYMSGDYIQKNTNVIAVGDMNTKVLHTEYVSKATVTKAKDIYAVIDGKRYEVTYEVMEQEEYTSLKKQNDVVYSTFYLHDPNNEVAMGRFASLVLVEDSRSKVLAVSSDVLKRNGTDYYCYLFDGTENVIQSVAIGLSDGMYTEILSGLSEGDKVLMDNEVSLKGEMVTLNKGSIEGEYESYGMLYYPSTEWVVNPAKYGTFYINEICIEQYEQVTKGQELAKIEVIPDSVSIARLERKIQRQQERLDKLLEKKSKIYHDEIDRALDRAIEARQKAIADYSEELAKLKQYTGIITLTAPYSGIITNLTTRKAGDLVSYNENIIQIANQSQCYVIVEDKEGQLSYGNEAAITYMAEGSVKKEIKGTVVSVCSRALSKQLNTGFALIRIAENDISEIAKYGSALGTGGGWSRNWFEITAPIRSVENVVLVPKRAVTLDGKNTFVKVKDESGNVSYVPFISGGSNQEYYWAIGGLSEGMEICLE